MILHLYIAFTRVLTILETRETVETTKAEEEDAHSKMQIDNPLWCHAVPECHLGL